MKRVTMGLVFCLGMFISMAYLQTARGQSAPDASQQKLLHFEDCGITFNYPASLRVSTEKKPDVATIMLESEETPFAMIQVYNEVDGLEETRNSLLKTFRNEYASRNAKFLEGAGKVVQRAIGGVEREGRMLELVFMKQPMSIEVYAFRNGETPIGVVIQYAQKEFDRAEAYFLPVMTSLK